MDLSKYFYLFLALCKTTPSLSFTKISKLFELLHWTKGVEWVKALNALGLLCIFFIWWYNTDQNDNTDVADLDSDYDYEDDDLDGDWDHDDGPISVASVEVWMEVLQVVEEITS